MGTSRAVLRESARAAVSAKRRAQQLAPRLRPKVRGLCQQIKQMSELTQRVLEQTRARVLKGDTHYPGKVLSVFEPHTEAIRKGKKLKPTEFGKLVKIQEAEAQFITDYEVCAERVPDGKLWEPSLERHQQLFGRAPHLATADADFASAANEAAATKRGVGRVALPRYGRISASRRLRQKQAWFRRAVRWRTGCEGRISALKRRHGLARCRYRGVPGMERWGGAGSDRQQLAGAGPSPGPEVAEVPREMNVSGSALKRTMKNRGEAVQNDRGPGQPRKSAPIWRSSETSFLHRKVAKVSRVVCKHFVVARHSVTYPVADHGTVVMLFPVWVLIQAGEVWPYNVFPRIALGVVTMSVIYGSSGCVLLGFCLAGESKDG